MERKILAFVLAIVILLVGVVIVFYLVGAFAPTLIASATQISNSGLPLAGLFSSTGVLFLILMTVIFLGLLLIMFSVLKGKAR